MTPSGTLVLRLAGAVRQGENPIEESTMPNRHEKNIEKVFPVFGHRFVAKVVQQCSSKMNLALCCRPSTSLSTVQWIEISSGVSASRQFTVSQSIRMTISCTQGLSCEQCGMTLHKWCYTKIVTPCPGSTQFLILSQPLLNLSRLSQRGGRDAMKFEARIAHNFKLKTYGKPTFCELCGSLLWGITKQGYQCTSPNCYLNVHNECREVGKRQIFHNFFRMQATCLAGWTEPSMQQ